MSDKELLLTIAFIVILGTVVMVAQHHAQLAMIQRALGIG